jgi:hypothetical protein
MLWNLALIDIRIYESFTLGFRIGISLWKLCIMGLWYSNLSSTHSTFDWLWYTLACLLCFPHFDLADPRDRSFAAPQQCFPGIMKKGSNSLGKLLTCQTQELQRHLTLDYFWNTESDSLFTSCNNLRKTSWGRELVYIQILALLLTSYI